MTSSIVLQNGIYISILVSMERQFQVAFIDMEHDWKKATLKPAVAVKNRDATNLTRHFKGGSVPFFGRRNDTLKQFVR